MRTITCNCGASAQVDDNRFHTPPGWDKVPTFDQKLITLCPTCMEKVRYHASEIYKLIGNMYPSISAVLRKV